MSRFNFYLQLIFEEVQLFILEVKSKAVFSFRFGNKLDTDTSAIIFLISNKHISNLNTGYQLKS
ncbi:MAG: hypothetical protein D8M61_11085 [Ignavibacteriae bacterium]|nr:hypothetical protein [Ignavibacteriota bacterium]